jgi:hypothetical protein
MLGFIRYARRAREALRREAERPFLTVRIRDDRGELIGVGTARARLTADWNGRPKIVADAPVTFQATRYCHARYWETDYTAREPFAEFPDGVGLCAGDTLRVGITITPGN